MNIIRTLVSSLVLIALVFFGAVSPRDNIAGSGIVNLTKFFFFFLTPLMVIGRMTDDGKAAYYKQLKDGRHLPRWADVIVYTVVVLGLAYAGWFAAAVIFSLAGGQDLYLRDNAPKTETDTKQKSPEEVQPHLN